MADEALDALFAEWGVSKPGPAPAPTPIDQILKSAPVASKAPTGALQDLLASWGASPKIEAVDPEAEKSPLRYGAFKVAPGGAPPGIRADMGALNSEVEKFNYLTSQFGSSNVLPVLAASGGDDVIGFRFRPSEKEPWRFVDPSPGDVGQGKSRVANVLGDAVGDAADVAVPFAAEALPGAIAGAGATMLAGPLAGAVAGAAGDAFGTYARDAYASKLPGYDASQHDTDRDAAINGGASLVLGMAPIVGRFAKPGVRTLAARAGKELILDEGAEKVAARTGAEMIKERLALSGRTGVDLTPGQATGSRQLLQLQDAASSVGKYADNIRAVEINQQRQANAFLKRALDAAGSDVDAETAGKSAANAYERYLDVLKKQRREATKPLFDEADAALGGQAAIPINGFIDTIDDMIAKYESPGSSSGTQSLVGQLKGIRSGLVADNGQRAGVSVSELSAMLSDWGAGSKSSAMDVFKDTDPRRAQAIAARLFGSLKKDMAEAAGDEAVGAAAEPLRKALALYAEKSVPINEARNALLEKALKLTKTEQADIVGSTFAASRSPAQIRHALSVLTKASKSDPDLAGAATAIKRDMLNSIVEGAESGAESVRARVDISPQKFASQMSKSKNRAKVMAILGTGDDAAESVRMWNDAIEIMSVVSDRGLPPGSPTASRLMNAAEGLVAPGTQAVGATAGAMLAGPVGAGVGSAIASGVTKGRAFINSKMLAELAADPIKRDEFYRLVATKGRGISGAGKAWVGADALLQLGVVEIRDAQSGNASVDEIQRSRARQTNAPGATASRD